MNEKLLTQISLQKPNTAIVLYHRNLEVPALPISATTNGTLPKQHCPIQATVLFGLICWVVKSRNYASDSSSNSCKRFNKNDFQRSASSNVNPGMATSTLSFAAVCSSKTASPNRLAYQPCLITTCCNRM